MYYVYRHIRKDNGLPFYVGYSKIRNEKLKKLKSYYKRAYNFKARKKAWEKIYNVCEGVDVEILFESENKEKAKEKEKEFISIHGRAIDGGLLCNMSYGKGFYSFVDSEKIAKTHDYCKGYKNPASRKVIDTVSGKIYGCIKDAANSINMKRTTLNAMLKGKNKNKTNFKYFNEDAQKEAL